VSSIDTAIAEMNTAWTAASEDMYKASQGAGADANGNGEPHSQHHEEGEPVNAGDNVTDAEFEEVK
jgi:molecular chaperone DnaK